MLLDSLSFENELRRDQALKSISPGFKKHSDREEVFGDDLPEIIQHENETNKLFNDAAWQRHRSLQNRPTRTQSYSSLIFRLLQTSRERGRNNWNKRQNSNSQGNHFNGGLQTRQNNL